MTFEEIEIPADIVEDVKKLRGELIEAVAEYDDTLLEKFFEDPDSITKEEIVEAVRKATIDMNITPVLCGSAFKNKGVQTMLDCVVSLFTISNGCYLLLKELILIQMNLKSRKADPTEPFCCISI